MTTFVMWAIYDRLAEKNYDLAPESFDPALAMHGELTVIIAASVGAPRAPTKPPGPGPAHHAAFNTPPCTI